jgi:hypothetical protein
MKWLVLLAFVFSLNVFGGDISGTWKGTADTPNGPAERTFVFKADGEKLTGESTSNMFGKSTIEDGKIEGDNISFTLTINFQGTEGKVLYKGKVEGDQIKFTVEIPALQQTLEYTAKRVSG